MISIGAKFQARLTCSKFTQVSSDWIFHFGFVLILALTTLQEVMAYHNVFVYGTLKTGEPNYHWFNDDNGYWKYNGKAKTVEKYPLIIGTKYNIPFLLYSPGSGTNVVGEVYEVDDKMLENLDRLEEHPTFYVREKNKVLFVDGSNSTECWIYFLKKFRPELLNTTFYEEYKSNGDHGLRYVERYLREKNVPAKSQVFPD